MAGTDVGFRVQSGGHADVIGWGRNTGEGYFCWAHFGISPNTLPILSESNISGPASGNYLARVLLLGLCEHLTQHISGSDILGKAIITGLS